MNNELIIGSHVSFNKNEQLIFSIKEALSYNANAFMFYTGAPQNTNRCKIDDELTKQAYALLKQNNIDINNIIVHAPYIINLANNGTNYEFAINFLKEEIKRCEELGITKLVLHPGSHVNLGTEVGLNNIINALNSIINDDTKVIILLETMAGKGSECGKTIDELKFIIDNINFQDKIGVCVDTCHINDAGYDLNDFDAYLSEFDAKIGIDKIKCIHINDSKNIIGSHKDRHENIGMGTIGFDNLLKVIYHDKLKNVPKILETPYVSRVDDDKQKIYPPYKFEIAMIRNKKYNDNLINDIRVFYK